jgi:hypothetical protein
MFSTGNMNGITRRLSIALLLVMLLVGITVHLTAPVSGAHYTLSESACAFHHGINAPAGLQPSWKESGDSPELTHDDTCVLELIFKIPHPPTI